LILTAVSRISQRIAVGQNPMNVTGSGVPSTIAADLRERAARIRRLMGERDRPEDWLPLRQLAERLESEAADLEGIGG
jgi:hypothetical protein